MAVNGIELAVGQVWKTRGGKQATIVSGDSEHKDYPIIAELSTGDRKSYGLDGKFSTIEETRHDLVHYVCNDMANAGGPVGDIDVTLQSVGAEEDGALMPAQIPERLAASKVNPTNPSKDALDVQVGGDHYKSCAIQPVEYIHANGLDFFQGNVVKYITRHKSKNGAADLRKAIHYCQLALQLQYGEKQ